MTREAEEFQEIFDALDTDNSGRISVMELKQALANTGENVTLEACHLLISLFDQGTGSVDLKGFSSLCQLQTTWRQVFQSFDKDKSGFIDKEELEMALNIIFEGVKFDKSFILMLINKFGNCTDDDGSNGQLNDEQFLLACAFVQKDKSKKLNL